MTQPTKRDLAIAEPVAWRLMVRRADTEWRQYALYETEKAAQRTLEAVKGDPLIVKVEPLYAAPQFRVLTDEEIECVYGSALGQSLRTQDARAVSAFARAALEKAREK